MRFRARLSVALTEGGPTDTAIRRLLRDGALVIKTAAVAIEGQRRIHEYGVAETRTAAETELPAVVEALARLPGVASVSWRTMA